MIFWLQSNIAWRRAGGGHYESVTEIHSQIQAPRFDPSVVIGQDNSNTRPSHTKYGRGLDIDNSKIKQIDSHIFSLETMLDDCSQEHCYSKCKNLPCVILCYHMYKCTSIDYNNGYICKHIHKIHSISKVTQINVNDSEEDCDLQFCHSEADQPPKSQRNTSSLSDLITFWKN